MTRICIEGKVDINSENKDLESSQRMGGFGAWVLKVGQKG